MPTSYALPRALSFSILFLALGCGSSLPSLSATVRAHPDMVVAAFVDVSVPPGATSVAVDYGDTIAYSLQTSRIPTVAGSSTLSVPVIGLTGVAKVE